jgi:hypothetical protein
MTTLPPSPHIYLLLAGVPIKAPIVDGLSGTVYAMEATIRALVSNLPAERKSHPTIAILGGGGYIGARLVSVLATRAPGESSGGVLAQSRRSTGTCSSLEGRLRVWQRKKPDRAITHPPA